MNSTSLSRLPSLTVEGVSLDFLRPDPANLRRIREEELDALERNPRPSCGTARRRAIRDASRSGRGVRRHRCDGAHAGGSAGCRGVAREASQPQLPAPRFQIHLTTGGWNAVRKVFGYEMGS